MKSDLKQLFFDFEVYKNHWLVSFWSNEEQKIIFRIWDNRFLLLDFIIKHWNDYVFVSFNGTMYDNHILKAIFYNASQEDIKDLSDYLIQGGKPWEHRVLKFKKNRTELGCYDIMPLVGKSLKEIELNLGMELITEDLGFDREITNKDFAKIEAYNEHDCKTTGMLFEDMKIGQNAFKAKNILLSMYDKDMNYWSKTVPSITSEILGATKIEQDQTWQWKRPKCLQFKDDTIIREMESTILEASSKPNWSTIIKNIKLDCKVGGIHGGIKNYFLKVTQDDEFAIILMDITSLYVNLMTNDENEDFQIYPRSLSNINDLRNIKHKRATAKKENKAENMGLKLPLVSAFGISGAKDQKAYDWSHNRNVCMTGESCFIELGQHLSEHIEEFIQFNTDGIYAKIRKDKVEDVLKVIKDFENRTKLEMEIEIINSGMILQDAVNDYIIKAENNQTRLITSTLDCIIDYKTKTKGRYSYYYGPNAQHCDYPCVIKAVVDFVFDKVPLNVTLVKLLEEKKYLWFAKVVVTRSRNYKTLVWNGQEIGKLARTFASTNENYTQCLKKKVIKTETNEDYIGYEKPSNSSEHTFVYNQNMTAFNPKEAKLDLLHYCKLAMKLLKEKKI